VQQKITDVERLKKAVRKLAATQVLTRGSADVCQDLGRAGNCRARIAAGFGALSKAPEALDRDRLIWILDGYVEVHGPADQVTHIRQGESTILFRGQAYRLVFPQLGIYLVVEQEG
jgi:hypothetical protein